MPLEADIAIAYASYYTHQAQPSQPTSEVGRLRKSYRFVKHAYLTDKYGYEMGLEKRAASVVGKLLYLLPRRRHRADEEVRFLHWSRRGRLLDIGCGAGDWLHVIRRFGWQAEGVDFDDESVRIAHQQGLTVHFGSVEDQRFPDETFDAITLSHVIEHVHDPIKTLTECLRILKAPGQLVLFTPNVSSLGHRVFGRHWRGLEPPRHLHLFSPRSTRLLLNQIGFNYATICTYNSHAIWKQTFALLMDPSARFGVFLRRLASRLGSRFATLVESCALTVQADAGEWLCITAKKS
jgi:2-polyprenyl-3-methyl-5-hydroxy-6-metoxy-1,4-benzoquinol methylase